MCMLEGCSKSFIGEYLALLMKGYYYCQRHRSQLSRNVWDSPGFISSELSRHEIADCSLLSSLVNFAYAPEL